MTRKYTWLSGTMTDADVMGPIRRVKVPKDGWADVWAERVARGVEPPHFSNFHRHTDACEWTDVSKAATRGFGALPLRQCQFGGIQDLRHQ